jgi:hypothetical protein
MSALGRERPVSTKLKCRADTPASSARSSWLSRRRLRQSRSSGPTPAVAPALAMRPTLARRVRLGTYLGGNRPVHRRLGPWTEDGTYLDPLMSGSGHDSIVMIGLGRERFPAWISAPSPAAVACAR